ncbi:hypothetical protein HG536_0G01890 [Torulaspora globosa]|uniref:pH-response regulator protein palF/RIM8 n=1 Tax=Torulaspora globosa TaxID=48254 RepID=A0A7G3ZLE4_9SACH|nr:uncharacterized protein HG536_0G01890 [Torulaspora globosa]QLL34330.1 hypothetical protein HG536_0G01890 [Torulaspora globosa]
MSILSLFKRDGEQSLLRRRNSNYTFKSSSGILHNSVIRQFYIEVKEPHRVWKPNEYISGEAVLVIKKDVTNIALRLVLSSEIKVRACTGATGRRKRAERLYEKSTLLYGEDLAEGTGDGIINGLTKGEHRFPFRIKIPSGRKVFSSIKFERGSIRHFLQCQIESIGSKQAEKPISCCEESFAVIVPVDVSELPSQKVKKVVLQSASMVRKQPRAVGDGSSSSLTRATNQSSTSNSSNGSNKELNLVDKTVTISVNIPHSGFAIGETVPVNVAVQHYKEFCHPAGLIVTLTRICRVNSGSKDEPMETFRKDLCQSISPLYVDAKTLNSNLTVYLKVPIETFSTFTSLHKYFTFQYYIEVVVNLSQKNIVYTESNRAIGVPSESVHSQQGANLEENLSQIQRKFLMMVGNDSSMNEQNNIESNIFYKDMVNVEKLKRQNNVTGMSIETVIGTTRSQNPPQPVELDQTTQIENVLAESPLASNTASPKHAGGDWLNPPYVYEHYPPVPQYTPNKDIRVINDKQEMEYMRLKQLESSPPRDY